MRIENTNLPGPAVIHPIPFEDDRGLFARTFCEREFAQAALPTCFVQCSTSFNRKQGTLRGMHAQAAPHQEDKLVRCTRGSVFDVIVDIQDESPHFGQWFGVTLSAENRLALFVPKGFAHGFLTLQDDSEVFYQMTEFYIAGASIGFRSAARVFPKSA